MNEFPPKRQGASQPCFESYSPSVAERRNLRLGQMLQTHLAHARASIDAEEDRASSGAHPSREGNLPIIQEEEFLDINKPRCVD